MLEVCGRREGSVKVIACYGSPQELVTEALLDSYAVYPSRSSGAHCQIPVIAV
jgi:hypothetical protein